MEFYAYTFIPEIVEQRARSLAIAGSYGLATRLYALNETRKVLISRGPSGLNDEELAEMLTRTHMQLSALLGMAA